MKEDVKQLTDKKMRHRRTTVIYNFNSYLLLLCYYILRLEKIFYNSIFFYWQFINNFMQLDNCIKEIIKNLTK